MLKIHVESREIWDEKNERFLTTKDTTLNLEHSLVSMHKWEKKYHKSFIKNKSKTSDEWVYYIKCMTLTQNVDEIIFSLLTKEDVEKIIEYINDPMSATYIRKDDRGRKSREVPTAEYFYYIMFTLGIPKECEKWHFNTLMSLIHIFEIKSGNKKGMKKNDIARNYAALNKQRLRS